jgi:hypothetical protein
MTSVNAPWYEIESDLINGIPAEYSIWVFQERQPTTSEDVKEKDLVLKPYLPKVIEQKNGIKMALDMICQMVLPVTSSNKWEIVIANATSIITAMQNMVKHLEEEIKKSQSSERTTKGHLVLVAVSDLRDFIKSFLMKDDNVKVIEKWLDSDLIEHERRVVALMDEINRCQLKCGFEVCQYRIEYLWHMIKFPVGSPAAIYSGQLKTTKELDQKRRSLNRTEEWYIQHQKDIIEIPPRAGLGVYEKLLMDSKLDCRFARLIWIELDENAVKKILEALVTLVVPLSLSRSIGMYTAFWAIIKRSLERLVDYLEYCEETKLPDYSEMRTEMLKHVMELKRYFEDTVFTSSRFVKRIWKVLPGKDHVKRVKDILKEINKCQVACRLQPTNIIHDWGVNLKEQDDQQEEMIEQGGQQQGVQEQDGQQEGVQEQDGQQEGVQKQDNQPQNIKEGNDQQQDIGGKNNI